MPTQRPAARIALPVISLGVILLVGLLFGVNVLNSHAQSLAQKAAAPPETAQAASAQATSEEQASEEQTPEQVQRFTQLETLLTGAILVGHSTTTGGEKTELEPDRYELTSVKHVGHDRWLFMARIRYGKNDVTIPMTLPIHWAGDTPVITVDNMGFPGLGTYTARVMIYADHYAGFWSGGDHGGHLFGVVKRIPVVKTPGKNPEKKHLEKTLR